MIVNLVTNVFNGICTAITDFVEWPGAMPTMILGAAVAATAYVFHVTKEN